MLRWVLDHWIQWRWLNHLYAKARGYSWLPCPICEQPFGEHERHRRGSLVTELGGRSKPVCRHCRAEAKFRNWRDFDVYEFTDANGLRMRYHGFRGKADDGEWVLTANPREAGR